MPDHPRCESCRFWRSEAGMAVEGQLVGLCCRRSPQRQWRYALAGRPTVTVNWPITTAVDGCGEHEESKEE